jgi:hypothetical protein
VSCADDLATTNERIQQYRVGMLAYYTQASNLRAAIESLRAQLAGRTSASHPVKPVVGPTSRPATQPQKEERAVGSDELAQYAALTRDITDMEARLDRLEAR